MNFLALGRKAGSGGNQPREFIVFANVVKQLAKAATAKPTVNYNAATGNLKFRMYYKDVDGEAAIFTISCSGSVKAELLEKGFKTGTEALVHCVTKYGIQVLTSNYVTGAVYENNVYKFAVDAVAGEEINDIATLLKVARKTAPEATAIGNDGVVVKKPKKQTLVALGDDDDDEDNE